MDVSPGTSTATRMLETALNRETSTSATPSTRGPEGVGVAGEAVRLICEYIREHRIGTRAAIRVDPENHASVRVSEKSGFSYVHDFTSGSHEQADGTPVTMRLYVHHV
jgi:hypothetical protein